MKKIIRALLALTAFGFMSPAFALEGESIVFNPATGNYLITYLSSRDDKLQQVTFIPATKINPTFKSKLKLDQGEIVHYGYSLSSGRDSQQDIVLFTLDPVSSVTSSLPAIPLNAPPGKIMGDMMNVANYFDTPAPWHASMGYSDGQMSFRIGWSTKVANGFHPGSKAVFGFKSRDLPGIIQAEVYGYAPGSQEIPGEETQDAEDGGFGQQYEYLILNNFVRSFVAVPTIPIPTPFDAAILLDRIQTQMHTWIALQLLDPALSAQLDRYFQSAISAYRLNQPKVGKKHIQTMRELIKKEQPEADNEEAQNDSGDKHDTNKRPLIDKLAARILDFDLKYVTKRMDKGD